MAGYQFNDNLKNNTTDSSKYSNKDKNKSKYRYMDKNTGRNEPDDDDIIDLFFDRSRSIATCECFAGGLLPVHARNLKYLLSIEFIT